MKETDRIFIDGLRDRLSEELVRWDYPSVAIGIVKDGEVLMEEGIGLSDVSRKIAADKNTIYNSGSCGKAYTVALVDLLVDQGKLDWDTPIVNYCPEVAFADSYVTAHVTLRDILSHRTGLPRHDFTWYNSSLSKSDIIMNMRYMELNKPFRTRFQYSNQCYMLAGYIVERITGMSYEECLKKMIFEPLGMKHSAIFSDEVLAEPNHALPYDRPGDPNCFKGMRENKIETTPSEDLEKRIGDSSNPAGCISIDVEDSLKWVNLWLNKGKVGERQFIEEKTIAENFYPNTIISGPTDALTDYCYGMGWYLGTYKGEKLVFHGGNIQGFSTLTFLLPSRNMGMIFFCNFSLATLGYSCMYSLVDHELGLTDKDWFDEFYDRTAKAYAGFVDDPISDWRNLGVLGDKREGTAPSHPLADYCGTYEVKGYDPISITEQNGGLYLNGWLSSIRLEHYHYDTFVVADYGKILGRYFPVYFHLNDFDGSVKNLSMKLNLEEGASATCFEKK